MQHKLYHEMYANLFLESSLVLLELSKQLVPIGGVDIPLFRVYLDCSSVYIDAPRCTNAQ